MGTLQFTVTSKTKRQKRKEKERKEKMGIVVISDIHLGSNALNTESLKVFLHDVLHSKTIHTLIINGDAYDNPKKPTYKNSQLCIIELLQKIKRKKQLVLIQGNHDPSPETITPLGIFEPYVNLKYASGNNIFLTHGDRFDKFISNHPALTDLADSVYTKLQYINKGIASKLKRFCKSYTHNCQQVEDGAVKTAKCNKNNIVICGHTHTADETLHDNIQYINTGCWTDSLNHYVFIDNYGNCKLCIFP